MLIILNDSLCRPASCRLSFTKLTSFMGGICRSTLRSQPAAGIKRSKYKGFEYIIVYIASPSDSAHLTDKDTKGEVLTSASVTVFFFIRDYYRYLVIPKIDLFNTLTDLRTSHFDSLSSNQTDAFGIHSPTDILGEVILL